MNPFPRVAFLPDTFHEINGVAHTSRQLEAFVRRRQIPFLSVHCGPDTCIEHDGTVTIMQLKRSTASIGLDAHLEADPLLMRYQAQVGEQIRNFGADLIHVTGPGDMGILGSYLAARLRLPMVISWHTALHEYAGKRLERLLGSFGTGVSSAAAHVAEVLSLGVLSWFYRKAKVVLAPNDELVKQLKGMTASPVFLMSRGVDTELFTPARRARQDQKFRLGYVGRLTPEKNVRFLADIGKALLDGGHRDFEICFVGQGNEEEWLRANVPNAVLAGVRTGEALAQAYADMDLFLFPSKTDTFGNVVLEALASAVPCVVTSEGGPKFLVEDGVTGNIASDDETFIGAVLQALNDRNKHRAMAQAARSYALRQSWDSVFEKVFDAYRVCLIQTSAG